MNKRQNIFIIITSAVFLLSCVDNSEPEPEEKTAPPKVSGAKKADSTETHRTTNPDAPVKIEPSEAPSNTPRDQLTSDEQFMSVLDRATQLRNSTQFETALEALSKIEIYPSLTKLQRSLIELHKGYSYREMQLLVKAKLAFEKSISLNPKQTNAMLHLSDMYSTGFAGIELNSKLSWYYLELATELGDLEALIQQGIRFRDGIQVEPNQQKAFDFFFEAYQAKRTDAMVLLSEFYSTGEVVQKDKAFALKLLVEAYDAGNVGAIAALGNEYYFGDIVEQDLKKAFNYELEAAKKGNRDGMRTLGVFYDNGIYVDVNIEKAAYWFKKAADQGDPSAMVFLAMLYENERGVDQNHQKAFELYSSAAEAGDGDAMAYLGDMYQTGRVVEKNLDKAIELFKQSSELGNPRGHFFLGSAFAYGLGIGKNTKKAIVLFEKGAAAGGTKCLMSLGNLYEFGWDVTKSLTKAENYYKEAFKLGEYAATEKFAGWYRDGIFYPKNHKKAKELYESAIKTEYTSGFAGYALLLATSADEDIRNGNKAVEYAEKAAFISNEEKYLEFLAAAYAANAQFELAVETQTRYINYLIELGLTENDIEQERKHLEGYKNSNARYDYQ